MRSSRGMEARQLNRIELSHIVSPEVWDDLVKQVDKLLDEKKIFQDDRNAMLSRIKILRELKEVSPELFDAFNDELRRLGLNKLE
ncbi:MAG: hypothetical protein M1275_02970 [Patescibacteria group bacterium]|nr:hypothetical protein [Patescibacteria group bacterium]